MQKNNVVDFCFKILTTILGETPEEEFKVSYKGNMATIVLPIHVSLEDLNKLSAEEREKIEAIVEEDHVLLCVYA